MANILYNIGKAEILEGTVALGTMLIKVMLIDDVAYTPVIDGDLHYDDVSAHEVDDGDVNYTDGGETLANKSFSQDDANDRGEFDNTVDITWTTLTLTTPADKTIDSYLIYYDSTVPATSPLIAYVDTASGLPLVTNGSDVKITWNAEGILQLG